MKRSQRFSSSFSFEEDQQPQPKTEDKEEDEELSSKNSNGVPVAELVETELAAECLRLETRDNFCDRNDTSRFVLFRPQALWLAMTRCLSLRWPPCLSISRQSNRELIYQLDLDQSEDTLSSLSCESPNESSSSTSPSDDRQVTLVKQQEEEVGGREVKSLPPPRRGISLSSPRLPRAKQATDSALASLILEKEMFLTIELEELVKESERHDLCYRAEWKLSEKTKELAEGVWLSRSQKIID